MKSQRFGWIGVALLFIILEYVVPLLDVSFKTEILLITVASFIFAGAAVLASISALKEKANEEGDSEKQYNLGSVLTGAAIGFVVIFASLCYDIFLKGRHER